jgi:hypothetical protein
MTADGPSPQVTTERPAVLLLVGIDIAAGFPGPWTARA